MYNSKTWKLSSYLIALVLIVPVLVMLVGGVSASTQLFAHLWQTVLPSYIENTLLLAFWVVLLALFFGVFSAAIITQTNIVFKQQLRWLLLLPLAMPAYLVAYLYTDLFDYAGPVQRTLRATFGWQSPTDYWFFDIRTLPGAALMLALVLFPYIYMLTRGAFEQQDQNLIRASRLLGLTAKQSFFKVALPLARPAIAVSASLVLMETLADFATVQYFSVNTLTTAIYDTWLGYGDLGAANALASILMLLILFVVLAEQRSRAGLRHQSARPNLTRELIQLSFGQQLIASIFCWALVILGFLLPITLLIIMAVQYSDVAQLSVLFSTGLNSLKVSVFAATIAVVIALSLGLYQRLHKDKYRKIPQLISGFGYAVPGTVLAMAMLSTLGPLDHWINGLAEFLGFSAPGLILSGSLFAIVFALVVRFSAIANGTIASGIKQIPQSLDYAPATLGVNLIGSLTKVHLPILSPAILVAWLLVFVEAMKELPAVLLLRPFNFETLSSQIYQLISDEMLEQGALGAILIVLFGLLPIVLLNKSKEKV
ncbi:iron ABC transporter permease [Colwellia psychrerythraea]|uniref:Iron ABC transporter permease n=1 Tax=Colwellia psychrerythraea TaxID=28229 RepID=A0A1Y5EH02_COLPS|nr:iron ABC transporter permease [Colwellia psychrerythraea]